MGHGPLGAAQSQGLERFKIDETSSFHVNKERVWLEEVSVNMWLGDVGDGKGPCKSESFEVEGDLLVPNVLMLLPFAAVRGGPFFPERVSRLEGGITLTSAPMSTRKRHLE